MIPLRIVRHSFEFPARTEPAWAAQVERWSQLDAAAFGMAEIYDRHRETLTAFPKWILLASPAASNETDRQFAMGGARSPSKFVHTLPNIRSSSILRLMPWQGPLLCLQKDPWTVATALVEATTLLETEGGPIWIAGIARETRGLEAFLFILDRTVEKPEASLSQGQPHPRLASRDSQLLQWLAAAPVARSFSLGDGWEIRRHSPRANS